MRPILFVIAGLWLAAMGPLPARAASVAVQVLAPDGQPVPQVVVQVLAPSHVPRLPAEPAVVVQQGVRFVPAVMAIPAGASVRFVNLDAFDHHLRSQAAGPMGSIAPAKDFEFRQPGTAKTDKPASTDVRFERAGLVVLGCHLHSSMRGHVFVAETSLLGVTDSAGRAVIADVPEGRVELRLWHPEQLLDQAAARWDVPGAGPVTLQLNFTPARGRRR